MVFMKYQTSWWRDGPKSANKETKAATRTRRDWVLGRRTGLELREVLHVISAWERALQGLAFELRCKG